MTYIDNNKEPAKGLSCDITHNPLWGRPFAQKDAEQMLREEYENWWQRQFSDGEE